MVTSARTVCFTQHKTLSRSTANFTVTVCTSAPNMTLKMKNRLLLILTLCALLNTTYCQCFEWSYCRRLQSSKWKDLNFSHTAVRTLHRDQKVHNLVLKCQNTQQNGVFYGLTLYLRKALFNIILVSTLRSSKTNFIVVVFFSLCLAVIFSFHTLHVKCILIYTLIFSACNALTEMHTLKRMPFSVQLTTSLYCAAA
jgi:hypothetical protein